MNWKYILVLGFGVVLLIFFIAGYSLPKKYEMSRSIEINVSSAELLDSLLQIRSWPEWTPWNTDEDSTVRFGFYGPRGQAGTGMRWLGNLVGNGSIEITGSRPDEGITYNLFAHDSTFRQVGQIKLEQQSDSQTKVTWIVSGQLGSNPLVRIVGRLVPSRLAPAYSKSLKQLKARMED